MPHAELSVDRHEFRFDGATISVLIAGSAGPLPPVLAVHGFGTSAAGNWRQTGHLTALVRSGRQVIAPDLLGHGWSDKPTDPDAYSLSGLAELAIAALTEFTGGVRPGTTASGITASETTASETTASGTIASRTTDSRTTGGGAAGQSVDLLGYSLGARICWEILVCPSPRTGDRPTPRRAILGGFDGRALFDGVDVSALTAVLGGPAGSATERLAHSPAVAGPVAVQDLPPVTKTIVDIILASHDVRRQALLAVVRGLSGAPVSVGTPVIPLLFASGERDPLASGAERLVARLPAAEYLSIPGRDHISAVPAGVFRTATVDFLGR